MNCWRRGSKQAIGSSRTMEAGFLFDAKSPADELSQVGGLVMMDHCGFESELAVDSLRKSESR